MFSYRVNLTPSQPDKQQHRTQNNCNCIKRINSKAQSRLYVSISGLKPNKNQFRTRGVFWNVFIFSHTVAEVCFIQFYQFKATNWRLQLCGIVMSSFSQRKQDFRTSVQFSQDYNSFLTAIQHIQSCSPDSGSEIVFDCQTKSLLSFLSSEISQFMILLTVMKRFGLLKTSWLLFQDNHVKNKISKWSFYPKKTELTNTFYSVNCGSLLATVNFYR